MAAASFEAQISTNPACGKEERLPYSGSEAETEKQYSPMTYLATAKTLPPFRIEHGSADCIVNWGQSKELHEALGALHARTEMVLLSGASHEDPAFLKTQMAPNLAFLDAVLAGASSEHE